MYIGLLREESKDRKDYLDKRIPKDSTDSGVNIRNINPHLATDSKGNAVNILTGEIVWELL